METDSKKRRGRPPSLSPEWESRLRGLYPEVTTRRGIQNWNAVITAMGALRDESANRINFTLRPEYQWLGFGDLKQAGGGPLRLLLLQEIGRFPDTESMRGAARWVCERKPTAKKGAAILRQWRLVLTGRKARECTETQLEDALLTAITNCLDQYPQAAKEVKARGLEQVCKVLYEYARQLREDAAGT